MWRCLSTRRPATNSPSMPRRAEFPGPLVSWHTLTGAPATRCSGHPDGGRREPPGVPPHQAPGLHGARPRRVPRRALRSGACFAVVASATLAGRRARTSAQFAHCGGLVCLCACVLVCLCACLVCLCACVCMCVLCACVLVCMCLHVSACVFCVHMHAIPIADTLVVMPRVPRLFTTLMRWSRSFQHFIFDGMAKVGCASGCTCMDGCACPACTILGRPMCPCVSQVQLALPLLDAYPDLYLLGGNSTT